MKIFYWHNQGRLGNLLFQYAAIDKLAGDDDWVLCFNSEIFDIITTQKKFIKIPKKGKLGNRINLYLNLFFDLLAKAGVISNISPRNVKLFDNHWGELRDIEVRTGFFKNIYQIKGFFQHDLWICSALNIKAEELAIARRKLSAISTQKCRVALHVRLTDYRDWVVLGRKDVSVGWDWYKKAIAYARAELDHPDFILFTDDKIACYELGFSRETKIFDGSDPLEELLAMSLCEHAIISPSTFAYCASVANFSQNKLVIAPKYWAGFKSEVWYPPTIKSQSFVYLEVEDF